MPQFYNKFYLFKEMKRTIFILASLAFIGVQAQEDKDYNKWSVDFNGGFNKPTTPMTTGYHTNDLNLWGANAGVRYMFNNKFGFRLGGGYDSFTNSDNSQKFDSSLWNVNLQGVVNVGRALNFEEWTSDLGLLLHAGGGYGQLNSDDLSSADPLGFLVVGLTPQVRISNRVTFLLDGSIYMTSKQDYAYDTKSQVSSRGFQGNHFTLTGGLSIAIGKHGRHADWAAQSQKDAIEEVAQRVSALENNVSDLKSEVANKENRMNDANGNRVPDEIESYLNDNYQSKKAVGENGEVNDSDVAADLIRKGYINAYFDFNSSQPQISSSWAVDFVAKYMKSNPSANIHISGYADELGGTNYNAALSQKRADAVKNLLVKAGIDGSRITAEGKGVDSSVDKNSPRARQLARKAVFELK